MARRGQGRAVGAEGQAEDPPPPGAERADRRAGGQVPELDDPLIVACGEPIAGGADREARDRMGGDGEHAVRGSVFQVPHNDLPPAGEHDPPVVAEGQGVDAADRTVRMADLLERLHVPTQGLAGGVLAASREAESSDQRLAVGHERHARGQVRPPRPSVASLTGPRVPEGHPSLGFGMEEAAGRGNPLPIAADGHAQDGPAQPFVGAIDELSQAGDPPAYPTR